MGQLVQGVWHTGRVAPTSSSGAFVRAESRYRSWIEGTEEAPANAPTVPCAGNRYALYLAWACPWAHRTLLVRSLYGLEDALPVAFVGPDMLERGWAFDEAHPDPHYGHRFLHELYCRADPTATTKVTVPVLWDLVEQRIVNNESSEIIRMLAGPLARLLGRTDAPLAGHPLRPAHLRTALDQWNDRIYDTVNNGVYRCGFATSQAAYHEAATALFDTLDALEARLSAERWVVGNTFTEVDLRLFPTLVRMVPVYAGHFKVNWKDLRVDYPALWGWVRDVYQLPGVAGTVHLEETRRHYYFSHESVNPHRIVPLGPQIDHTLPHGRDRLGPSPVGSGGA